MSLSFGGSNNESRNSSSGWGTSTNNVTMPGWLQPTVRGYFNRVGGLLKGGGSGVDRQVAQGARGLNSPNYGMIGAMGATQGLLNYSPDQVTAGQLSNTDLSPYMNPFQQSVIDTTMRDMERGRQGAITQNQAGATAAGAYGGSRHGVADSLTNREFFDSAGATVAGLNAQNFGQAQDAARFDIGNRLGADTFNSQQGLAGANFRLGAADQLFNQGMGADANRRTNLGFLSQYGDPRYARLARVGGLLGINAGQLFGNRGRTDFEQEGTGEESGSNWGFGASWNPTTGFG